MKILIILATSFVALGQDKTTPSTPKTLKEAFIQIATPLKELKDRTAPGTKAAVRLDSFFAAELSDLAAYDKAVAAGDQYGITELLTRNQIAEVSTGTSVLIIDRHQDPDLDAQTLQTLKRYIEKVEKMDWLCRDTVNSSCDPPPVPPKAPDPALFIQLRVRVLDGEHQGMAYWARPNTLRLVPPTTEPR